MHWNLRNALSPLSMIICCHDYVQRRRYFTTNGELTSKIVWSCLGRELWLLWPSKVWSSSHTCDFSWMRPFWTGRSIVRCKNLSLRRPLIGWWLSDTLPLACTRSIEWGLQRLLRFLRPHPPRLSSQPPFLRPFRPFRQQPESAEFIRRETQIFHFQLTTMRRTVTQVSLRNKQCLSSHAMMFATHPSLTLLIYLLVEPNSHLPNMWVHTSYEIIHVIFKQAKEEFKHRDCLSFLSWACTWALSISVPSHLTSMSSTTTIKSPFSLQVSRGESIRLSVGCFHVLGAHFYFCRSVCIAVRCCNLKVQAETDIWNSRQKSERGGERWGGGVGFQYPQWKLTPHSPIQ